MTSEAPAVSVETISGRMLVSLASSPSSTCRLSRWVPGMSFCAKTVNVSAIQEYSVGFSLLRRHPKAFQLHRLVQAVVRNRLPPAEQRTVVARVAKLLAAAAPGDPNDLAHWSDYARLAPHILAASPYVGDHADTRRPMLDTLAYLLFRGEVRAGRRIAEELLERWQRQLGPYHPDTITAAAAVVGALEGT